jgi:UDP:flavonoid glycosyltransferase YjiC (YdhE family)
VPFAPHQKIIERSQLVITHAGMNTVLTALSCGVPIVAIPITNEQPGIAERLKRTKAGEAIQLKNLNEKMLRDVITKVLTQTHYREKAQRMKQNILEAGGVVRAVDIIEESLNA